MLMGMDETTYHQVEVIEAPSPQDALAKLQAYMTDGVERRQKGLISDVSLRAPSGVQEGPGSPSLMDRVCMAFCDLNHSVSDVTVKGGRRQANTTERLARCGVPAEMYLQMAQSPEFLRMLSRRTVELIVLPQLPSIQASLTAKASAGDEKAARILYEMAKLLELQEQDEIRRQYAHMDTDAWIATLREEHERIAAILAEYDPPKT